MSALGGFAAVSFVPQSVVDAMIDAAWAVLWRPAILSGLFSVPTPLGTLKLDGGVRIHKPTVLLRASPADRVSVQVTGHARFSARLGSAAADVVLQLKATVDVPLSVTQKLSFDKAIIDLRGFALAAGQVDIVWSDVALDPSLRQALLGPELRDWLAARVREPIADKLQIPLPTDQMALAELSASLQGPTGLVILPYGKIGGVRALDGWLAVAIDNTGSPPPFTSDTTGDLAQIDPPTGSEPIPGLLSPQTIIALIDAQRLLAYFNANVEFALRILAPQVPSVHVDKLITVTIRSGGNFVGAGAGFDVHLTGRVDAPDPLPGWFPMTADIHVTVGVSAHALEYFVTQHVEVDAPLVLDVLNALASMFGVNFKEVIDDISHAPPLVGATGFVSGLFDLPGLDGVRVLLGLDSLRFEQDLVHFYGSVFPSLDATVPPPASDAGLIQPGAINIRQRFLTVSLESEFLRVDPTFLVRFDVRRGSDNRAVASGQVWSGSGADCALAPIDLWAPSNYYETSFNVVATVERPPGNPVEIRNGFINVTDKFDRRSPYARWWLWHYWYDKRHKPHRPHQLARRSAIHKTAIRERCRFCDRDDRHVNNMEALNKLPAPADPNYRGVLCPYCFTADEIARLSGR